MNRMIPALLAATLLLAGCGRQSAPAHHGLRVIAMAPNTAEILYALGLSNAVAGVNRFTVYPPDVTNKTSVGGLYDPNWEIIVALQPDMVIGLKTQKEIEAQLKQLEIGFIGVSHEHIDEILQSIRDIGKACSAEKNAEVLIGALQDRLAELSASRKNTDKRVLVCVGHDETLSRMYVAARGTFYDELIGLAGGINACETSAQKYPEISPEGLASMHPDLVIDILPANGSYPAGNWKPYRAVMMTNDYASIPGPRFVLLLEDFSKAIHE